MPPETAGPFQNFPSAAPATVRIDARAEQPAAELVSHLEASGARILLAAESAVRRAPIVASEVAGLNGILTGEGDLRTLPSHLPHRDPRLSGLDGFYAARLVKS